MFSLMCAWINGWANSPDTSDLRRRVGHCDVTVMYKTSISLDSSICFPIHGEAIKYKSLPNNWLLCREIHRWPVDSTDKWPVIRDYGDFFVLRTIARDVTIMTIMILSMGITSRTGSCQNDDSFHWSQWRKSYHHLPLSVTLVFLDDWVLMQIISLSGNEAYQRLEMDCPVRGYIPRSFRRPARI